MYVQKPLVNSTNPYSDIIAIKYNEKSISSNLKTGSVHVRQSEQTKHSDQKINKLVGYEE